MSQIIQNIVAILSGYTNGKLFECRKEKRRKKSIVKDEVCISDEARKRLKSGGSEGATTHTDETYMKSKRQGE
jgi:hypothetical protein